MSDIKCEIEDRWPCGPDADLDIEIRKIGEDLSNIADSILTDIDNLEIPDTSGILGDLERTIRDHPNSEVRSLDDLANILGLPSATEFSDKERLTALGVGVIGKVGWKIKDDSTNFKDLRKLYKALGRDFSKTKQALAGEFGNYFIVNTFPRLLRVVSPYAREQSLEELINFVGEPLSRDQVVYKTETDGTKVALVFIEEFLHINQPIVDSAALKGVQTQEITTKLFSIGGTLTSFEINKLKAFGLTTNQISVAQGSTFDTSRVNTLLQETSDLLTIDITEANIIGAESRMLEVVSLLSYEYILLDKTLITNLQVKNTDAEIAVALDEPHIDGINIEDSLDDDKLLEHIDAVAKTAPGTHSLSNKMINRTTDTNRNNQIKALSILADVQQLEKGDDATPVAQDVGDLQTTVAVPEEPIKPNITYKSYDSGSSLMSRLITMDKTFKINFQLKKEIDNPISPISTKGVNRVLNSAYNSAFKTTDALGNKANQAIRDLESMTSLGLSITGAGSFDTGYLKCAAGIDFDFQYNPLRDLINAAIDAFNAFLDKVTSILRRILKEIQCKIQCLRDAVGLGGLKLDFPFCDIDIPPLLEVPDLVKFADILDNLKLQRMQGNNILKFGLLDMSDSFSEVSQNDCNCEPLGGFFSALKIAVPVGVALGAATGGNGLGAIKKGVGKLL